MKTEAPPGYHLPPGTLTPVELDEGGLGRSAGASIGKKYLMGITGLVWCLFALSHLAGNLLLYIGPEAYNGYAAKLLDMGALIYIAEGALVLCLLTHAWLGIQVTLENNAARPVKYAVDKAKGGRNLASDTMIWTGVLVIVFLVLHIIKLKYGPHTVDVPEGKMIDFHGAVVALFAKPLFSIWYIIAMIVLGFHLGHALQSSLRSLGFNTAKSEARVKKLSVLYGVVVAAGFASLPIWFGFLSKGGA